MSIGNEIDTIAKVGVSGLTGGLNVSTAMVGMNAAKSVAGMAGKAINKVQNIGNNAGGDANGSVQEEESFQEHSADAIHDGIQEVFAPVDMNTDQYKDNREIPDVPDETVGSNDRQYGE